MNQGLLLFLAATIGVFGIVIVFRNSMAKIIEGMKNKDYKVVERLQTQMFVRILLVEIVPIILIVVAIMDMF